MFFILANVVRAAVLYGDELRQARLLFTDFLRTAPGHRVPLHGIPKLVVLFYFAAWPTLLPLFMENSDQISFRPEAQQVFRVS